MPWDESGGTRREVTIPWSFRWEFQHQAFKGGTLRGRAARWVRRLATWIDGGEAVVVTFRSEPRLPPRTAERCVVAGMRHAGRLWEELAQEAALDAATRAAVPELYADRPD